MPEPLLADHPLALRLERAGAEELLAFAESARTTGVYPDAAAIRVGGGTAAWFSPGNVVNGASGLGMDREVEQEEVAALVSFFAERGETPKIDVCPHCHPSLLRWLAEAGFVAAGFEMVLFQPLPAVRVAASADGVTVRVANTSAERELWANLEARGFTEGNPSAEHLDLSRSIALRDGALHFIGFLDGEPAGTGMLSMREGLGMLNGDSTLPESRCRGVQTALLAARLTHAWDNGCDLCCIEAAPGGSSYRNQQRAGFRIAYNRVTVELPLQNRE